MKKVLVLYYTQSGQLEDIARKITKPLEESNDVTMTFCEIKMKKPFPFPWDSASFFDVFPESYLEIPSEVAPVDQAILNQKYDLVVLAYQIWFLSISIPVNSFLKSSDASKILKDTPVVTIIGCRNMWMMAHQKLKDQLKKLKATSVGNIVLVDRAPNLISVITIVKWMFSGEKKKYLGIFPKPGVSDSDINNSEKFGETLLKALHQNDFQNLQDNLIKQNAVEVSDFLLKSEAKGSKIFSKWANFIIVKKESRRLWLKAFNVYLFLAIWIISPIVYILHILTFLFTKKGREKRKNFHQRA